MCGDIASPAQGASSSVPALIPYDDGVTYPVFDNVAKLSFRQLLLLAFLLITMVLSATSVQALLTLERLARQSREAARQAIQLTEDSQRLAERTLAMERSARQFLVLDDSVFRDRYAQAWQDARIALQALAAGISGLPAGTVKEWLAQSGTVAAVLRDGKKHNRADIEVLARVFVRLPQINDNLALASKREIARRNDVLLSELERQRRMLAVLVAATVLLTALLALGFGFWLSRPLARIESAIERLGENRFDQEIEVGGPADTRRLGHLLNWLRQRLADLEADKARFLRHISHELKTPLAAMCEGVALLEDEVAGKLSLNQREVAGILRQNTQSLQAQIEDLLRYNAAAFGAQHLQRVAVDVEHLLHKVIDDQRLQWQARNLQIDVHGAAAALTADADKLGIALANILSNAVRFSPPGGVICFIFSVHPKHMTIDCIDQGLGVAASDAARLFEPFYQGVRQPSGARKGNGIGLSIVREYVEAHHGAVRLLPHDGGAHFQIDLPYDA